MKITYVLQKNELLKSLYGEDNLEEEKNQRLLVCLQIENNQKEEKMGKLLEELKKVGLTAEIEDEKTLEIQSEGFTNSPLLRIQMQNHNLIYKTLYWLRVDNMAIILDVLERNKELIAEIIVDIE